jgi:hypothetical protein
MWSVVMSDAEFRELFARLEPSAEPQRESVERLLAEIDQIVGSPGAAPDQPDDGVDATTGPDGPQHERVYLVEEKDHRPLAFARAHVRRRHVIAVLAAVAAVVVVTVAVAVTRPGAHHQPQPSPVVPPPTPTPVAQPQLYWRDATGIGRANLDGTGIVRQLIPINVAVNPGASVKNGGCGLAADHRYLYWPTGNTVARANRDGTGVVTGFIVTGPGTNCVAVDGGHVYWVTTAGAGPDGTIGRANLDGTGVQQAFVPDAKAPCGLAVDAAHVYWANSSTGAIGRANIDGTGVTQDLFNPLGVTPPVPSPPACGVLVDGATIYWGNLVTPPGTAPGSCNDCVSIGGHPLDGGRAGSAHFATGPGPYLAFDLPCAHDSTYLYWTNSWPGTDGLANAWIGRATLGSPSLGTTFDDVQADFINATVPGGASLVAPMTGCAIGP